MRECVVSGAFSFARARVSGGASVALEELKPPEHGLKALATKSAIAPSVFPKQRNVLSVFHIRRGIYAKKEETLASNFRNVAFLLLKAGECVRCSTNGAFARYHLFCMN